jgi:dienelactone hydrolase
MRAADSGASLPRNLEELWADYPAMDKSTPLEMEVLKEWQQDGVLCRVLRYQVGVFKGAPARVAAFYASPLPHAEGQIFPALLDIHGGGQSASLNTVIAYAKRGYVSLSLNWGGNPMQIGAERWSGVQTDWGKLDATHPPQRNKKNHFAGGIEPDEYTLDDQISPRNSNWYVVLIAARRAVSLLESMPEVDDKRIGARGHSMGGKLTTNLAGIDSRIIAAVPSCGGAGVLTESQTDVPGGVKTKPTEIELACIADNAYIPRIKCPVLWLSPTNDFHAAIDNMAHNWQNMPDAQLRLSISPHYNHLHGSEHAMTKILWLEQHLKKSSVQLPQTPQIRFEMNHADGIPRVVVEPDRNALVQSVQIRYANDPQVLTRFWRSTETLPNPEKTSWIAPCPITSLDEPIFAYADVLYEVPPAFRSEKSPTYALSSRMISLSAADLKKAQRKLTLPPQALIDDGSRDWQDWYRSNWDHPPLWTASTRKLKDPAWRGRKGAALEFEIRSASENQLVMTVVSNGWGAFDSRKPAISYTCLRKLVASPEWQKITLRAEDFQSLDPQQPGALADWSTITECSISPSGNVIIDGKKQSVSGQHWQGPREIRNMLWIERP